MTEGVLLITDKENNTGYNIHEQQPHHHLVINTNNDGEKKHRDDDNKKKKKKKPGVFGFFKAAMFVLRHRSSKGKQQKTHVEVAAAASSDWKKLVSSMRPLHLQDNNKSALAPAPAPAPVESMTTNSYYCPPSPSVLSCGTMSQYASANDLQALDDPHATMSQYGSSNDLQSLDHQQASSSSGTMSQYTSANNLQELDDEEEDDDPDRVFDSIGADDMIDVKAEEFILQFYQQMRRQNIDSMSGQFDD